MNTPSAAPLRTRRLELIAGTRETVGTSLDEDKLAAASGVSVAKDWPPQEWDESGVNYLLEGLRPEAPGGWVRFIIWHGSEAPLLVGTCGATQPITREVIEPEIGYSVVDSMHRRGIASEAVAVFCDWIFDHPWVESIIAHTFPKLEASIGVLRKCGFEAAGPGLQPRTLLFRLRRSS